MPRKNTLVLPQPTTETPEQKEIRLLKRRLQKEKGNAVLYHTWYLQEKEATRKAKEELMYAGKLVKLQEDRPLSDKGLYKTLAEGLQIQNGTLLSMYDQSEKTAAEWKEKYHALLSESKTNNDREALSNLRHLEISPEGAKGLKDMIDQGLSLEEIINRATPEQLLVISKSQRSVQRPGDGLGTYGDRMKSIANFTAKAHKEILEEDKMNKAPAGFVRLICIKTDSEGKIEHLGRYTSPGLKMFSGCKFYPINELNGDYLPIDRFYVCEDQPKAEQARKKND
jgi:hypothetical protein